MLTPDQKDRFDKDGVVCLRGVLSNDEINALRIAVDAQMAGLGTTKTGYDFEDIARQTWEPEKTMNTGPADRFDMQVMKEAVLSDEAARPLLEDDLSSEEGCFFYDVAAWKKQRGVREVAFDSQLPSLVASLIDAKSLNFWEDTTFVKSPGTRQKTAFHQDLAYFQIMGDQCVIVWIALDPADLSNGVTEYVRGSHKWGEVYAPNVFVSQTPLKKSPEQRCPDIEGHRDDYDIISFDVQPGDVIIHHVLTVHGAGGNMSDRMRRAVSFRYCGDQVRYYDRPGAIPQVGVDHSLTDGDRLISRDYPHVWPKPWPEMNLADAYEVDFESRNEKRKTFSLHARTDSKNA
jgi:ectoine hydroxylase-related dioxygenase (phytanoyl-CoA dioxygenase family)